MGKERIDERERASAHIRICNQMCSYTSSSANSNSNSSSNKKLTSMYSDPLCHSNRNMSICVVMSRHHRSRCIMHTLHHIFHIRSSNLRCCLIVLTSIRCVVVVFFHTKLIRRVWFHCIYNQQHSFTFQLNSALSYSFFNCAIILIFTRLPS